MKIKVSKNLEKLAEIFSPNAKLFIVGGYVRNSLLGFTNTDIDICSKLPPDDIVQLLQNTNFEILEKSNEVGYVKIKINHEIYEHTTFRKDNYYQNGAHHVESVNYVEDLRQDAMRRDFTINALYYDIQTKKVIDIYSGLLDLKKQVVRTVEVPGYVLAHDGMRILRMIRIASELNFKIDFATLLSAKKYAHLLNDISPEKKLHELYAILAASKKYPISKRNAHIKAFSIFNQLRLWNSFYITTSKVHFKMIKKLPVNKMFYAFLIDVIDTVKPDCVEYYIKDLLGPQGFCLSNEKIAHTNFIICGYYDAVNKMNNKFYFFKYFNYFNEISEILYAHSKKLYAKYKFFNNYIIKHKLPTDVKDLKISGLDLKNNFPELKEKKYSAVLLNLLSMVFDGKIANEKEALLQEVKNDISNNNY